MLRLLHRVRVLRLLVRAQPDGLGPLGLDLADRRGQLRQLLFQQGDLGLELRHLAVQRPNLLRCVVALLLGIGSGRVAPALVGALVGRLLQQPLDELLDELLDLGEWVLGGDLARQGGQQRALELQALALEELRDGLVARGRRRLRAEVPPHRDGDERLGPLPLRLLQEGGRRLCGLGRSLQRLHRALVASNGLRQPHAHSLLRKADRGRRRLLPDVARDDVDDLRQGVELVLPDLRALVPGLRLVAAHVRELHEVLLVIEERRGDSRKLLALGADLLRGALLLRLRVRELAGLALDGVRLVLHEDVVGGGGADLRLIDLDLLRTEVAQERLEGLDDAVRVELVVLHGHLRSLLQEGRGLRGRLAAEAQGVGQQQRAAEGRGRGLQLEQGGRLGRLHGLDGALQRLKRSLEVGIVVRVELVLLRAHGGRLLHLQLSLRDVGVQLLDPRVQGQAAGLQGLNVGGQGRLLVRALADGLAPLLGRVAAEAAKLVVGHGLCLALVQDLGPQRLQELDALAHRGHLLLLGHLGLGLGGLVGLAGLPLLERRALSRGRPGREGCNGQERHQLGAGRERHRCFAGGAGGGRRS
mmetsp:Transcript_112741/g.318934  ORF Transcript_112741/g.318934 Transcript_112741/m.318934 type:complete len:586 (+) Transcript_112741:631-2388(+)